jgi:hypothetical protein
VYVDDGLAERLLFTGAIVLGALLLVVRVMRSAGAAPLQPQA